MGVFRSYLQYAEAGALEGQAECSHSAVSTLFEEEVAEFLRQAGHQVQMKVGTAGFFIDLAVFNANQPGSYLLGIECDGPEYNRARTARDRDRLRQQVMEGLGWQVYRLWSVEWFAHPEAERPDCWPPSRPPKVANPLALREREPRRWINFAANA